MNKFGTFFIILCLMMTTVFSTVLVNSREGMDVVTGILYSYLAEDDFVLIVNSAGVPKVLNSLEMSGDNIEVYSSSSPISAGLNSLIQNRGLVSTEQSFTDSFAFNLQLANELKSEIKMILVTDPSYSYNLVSLLPYANLKDAYVIYVDDDNYNEQLNFIESVNVPILLYGITPEVFESSLTQKGITYTEINTGDKYSDNIELVNKYYNEGGDRKSIIFTDGTFLEISINTGVEPVVLISSVIPAVTMNGVKTLVSEGKVNFGTLIGEEYISAVTYMRREIVAQYGEDSFSAWLKAKRSEGTEMVPLDIFPLSSVDVTVSIKSVQFNEQTNQLEIVYENKGNVLAFVQGDHELILNNEVIETLGDTELVNVPRNSLMGVSYDVDLDKDAEGDLTLSSIVMYGASQISLDKGFRSTLNVGSIDYADASALEVDSATFNTAKNILTLGVTNPTSENVYFKVSLNYVADGRTYLFDDDRLNTIGSESKIIQLSDFVGEGLTVEKMDVEISYGGREGFLNNKVEKNVNIVFEEEKVETGFDLTLLLILLLVVVVIVLLFFVVKKR